MTKILSRMSELAILAKDVTKNSTDVAPCQLEFTALQDQLRATIGGTTDIDTPLGTFKGITLFGANASRLTVTIGQAVGQDITIAESNLRQDDMLDIIGQDASGAYTLSVTDSNAIAEITGAIQQVATERSTLGAAQSRLEFAATTLQVEGENLGAAIPRIRDVDVAEESTQFAKYNILVHSGTAMLAQANQTPQTVLRLLQ
jgi:flagellin